MTRILLNKPVPMSERLERLRLFPGRHLGEDELDRIQDYTDARLSPVPASAWPGILRGLELDLPPARADGALGEGFAVRPGLAVAGNGLLLGLFYEARATWRALVERWRVEQRQADAAGVYYLVLRRATGLVDADLGIDPCRRTESDPLRDTRLETLGTLALRRLTIDPAALAAMTPAQVQNQVAALHLDGSFLGTLGTAVPLALLAVSALDPPPADAAVFPWRIDWVSQAAGRYPAVADSGAQVLLAQVQAAFAQALALAMGPAGGAGDADPSIADRLEADLRLDFLPAAGVLPKVLLEAPASRAPVLRWLPPHLGVDMVPVPEEAVAELVERHLPRRVLDLRRPAGDRLRLLLAVNEPDYRPDLLDFPAIDAVLTADLYRYHLRAWQAWREWRLEFDRLYGMPGTEVLTRDEVRALALPVPTAAPETANAFYLRMIAAARAELATTGDEELYPYDGDAPTPPAFYREWANADGNLPPLLAPTDPGLTIKYRLTQLDLERLDSRIRAVRSRLEKTRDYLLLQRQQLDAQTVSLAALGGGVAGDGSGMQVARWLPYTQLKVASEAAAAPRAMALSAGDGAFKLAQTQTVTQVRGTADFGASAKAAALASGIKGTAASGSVARARLSSVELGLQQDRLDRIRDLPKQTLTSPAIEGRPFQFGVLDHVQPEVREYESAYRAMRDLIATVAGMFDPPEAREIQTALEALGVPARPDTLHGARPPLSFYDLQRISDFATRYADQPAIATFATTLLGTYRRARAALDLPENPTEDESAGEVSDRYAALFRAGKILTAQIAYMESRYNRLEDDLEQRLRERIRLEAVRERLAGQIEEAGRRLAGLDGRRVERLGDYGVAQALVREDWARVHREDAERRRILTLGLRGLYYVRVRETPVSLALTDPLELRHGDAGDPVPGCDWQTEVDVPPALSDLFAAVLEVPMADWEALAPLVPRLPVERIPDLLGQRRYRFGQRRTALAGAAAAGVKAAQSGPALIIQTAAQTAVRTPVRISGSNGSAAAVALAAARPTAALAARMAPLSLATQGLYQAWSVFEVTGTQATLGAHLAEAARVLSLQDLLGSLQGPLQREFQGLHNRLEQCVVCLMDRLGALAPSLRFDWAQRAEDDALDTERPATWPGLERAEAEDFNAVRTIAELVAWWFRQLDPGASGGARTALRNLIRGALILSAHGDPAEILRGQVVTPPRTLAVGEPLRVALNRTAVPGTRLQVLDEAQRVVGLLAVQDQDARGTLAQVVAVTETAVRVTTGFSVVASAATRSLR